MIVYDQQAVPLTNEAGALLAGTAPVILPLFSPRSARLVADAGPVSGGRILPLEYNRVVRSIHWIRA